MIPYLEERLTKLDGLNLNFETVTVITEDGALAIDDAIEFLTNQEALPELIWE